MNPGQQTYTVVTRTEPSGLPRVEQLRADTPEEAAGAFKRFAMDPLSIMAVFEGEHESLYKDAAQEQPALVLEQKPSDYRLVGNSCWIAVGGFVVYVRKDSGGVSAEIYSDEVDSEVLSEAVVIPEAV